MICPSCGQEIADGNPNFCPYCRAQLKTEGLPQPQSPASLQSGQPAGSVGPPRQRRELSPAEYDAIVASQKRARRRSNAIKAVVGIVILGLIIVGIVLLGASQPDYLYNNTTCSISGFGAFGSGGCGGQLSYTSDECYANQGCDTYYYYLTSNLSLSSPTSFTIQFNANEMLGVSLTRLGDDAVIFNMNDAVLQSTTYQLSPGQYSLEFTNYNQNTVNFTITAYTK